MTDRALLRRIRHSVGAVGYLTEPLDQYLRDPFRPVFRIVGTAFLVRRDVVLTNRHVSEGLTELTRSLPGDPRYVQFVVPGEENQLRLMLCPFRRVAAFQHPHADVAAIRIEPSPDPLFAAIAPVTFPDMLRVEAGDHIGMYGYPVGTSLLSREDATGKRLYRLGPVLQQGYVSAIAPSDEDRLVDRLLLDARSFTHMSGAPVFRMDDGTFLGIHTSGHEQVTQFAFSMNAARVHALLAAIDHNSNGDAPTITLGPVHRAWPE